MAARARRNFAWLRRALFQPHAIRIYPWRPRHAGRLLLDWLTSHLSLDYARLRTAAPTNEGGHTYFGNRSTAATHTLISCPRRDREIKGENKRATKPVVDAMQFCRSHPTMENNDVHRHTVLARSRQSPILDSGTN